MSFIVHGLPMPHSCTECKFTTFHEDDWSVTCPFSRMQLTYGEANVSGYNHNRPDWCPIEPFGDGYHDESAFWKSFHNAPMSDHRWCVVFSCERLVKETRGSK